MTEIFTRINKDKYNVNFTTDNFEKYLFVQEAARICVDEDAPEACEFKSASNEGCGFCVDFCDNKKTQLFITHPKGGHAELIHVKFCPSCGRKLKGA